MRTSFSGSLCVGGEGVMELGFQFYSGENMSQVGRLLQASGFSVCSVILVLDMWFNLSDESCVVPYLFIHN